MRAYVSGTANLQAFGSKRFHFTIELKISYSVRFGLDLLISFGSTVQNWNCDNPTCPLTYAHATVCPRVWHTFGPPLFSLK